MISFDFPPLPNLVTAWDDNDDAEFFPVGTGRSQAEALEDCFERCLDLNPGYDSPEFQSFLAKFYKKGVG
jgi:hypothetical protein